MINSINTENQTFNPNTIEEEVQAPLPIMIHTGEKFKPEHGAEIPEEIWKSIFGGEKLENELWNKLLQEEDDYVVIKGSGVTLLLIGGFLADPETGEAIRSKRSDIDVDVPQNKPQIMQRARDIATQQGNFAVKTEIDGIEVDLVNEATVREQMKATLLEIQDNVRRNITNIDPESELYSYLKYHDESINALVTHLFDHDTHEDTYISTLEANTYTKAESIAIKLQRKNGKFVATLLDPLNTLKQYGLFLPSPIQQREYLQQIGVRGSMILRNQNPVSVYSETVQTAPALDRMRFHEVSSAYYPIASLGRLMRYACELNTETDGSPFYTQDDFEMPNAYYEYFLDTYRLADIISRKPDFFEIVDNDGRSNRKKQAELQHLSQYKIQQEFARAGFSDPLLAVAYMCCYLPMGSFVSQEVGDYFNRYHQRFLPNNIMLNALEDPDLIQKLAREGNKEESVAIEESLDFLRRAAQLYDIYYTKATIGMRDPSDLNKRNENYRLHYIGNPPESASHLIAFLCVSLNWDPEINIDDINDIVENWLPEGPLLHSWNIHTDKDFSYDVDVAEITEEMRRMKRYSGL